MAEFFNIRIDNLAKSISPSVLSRNRKKYKKGSKKRKGVTFDDTKNEDSEEEHKGKTFCPYHGTCKHTIDEYTTQKALVSKANQKKRKNSRNRKFHQAWVRNYGTETGEKGHEKEETKSILRNYVHLKRMGVSASDQGSLNSNSSKEGDIWKLGTGE